MTADAINRAAMEHHRRGGAPISAAADGGGEGGPPSPGAKKPRAGGFPSLRRRLRAPELRNKDAIIR